MSNEKSSGKSILSELTVDSPTFTFIEYFLRLNLHASTAKIIQAYEVSNPQLTLQFEKRSKNVLTVDSWIDVDALKDTNSEETVLQHGFQFHSSENGINFPVGKVDLSTLTKDGRVSGKVMKRLMLCKVAIGRAYNANEDFAKIAAIPDGYDSFVIDREGERKSDSSSSSSSGNNNNKQEKGRRNRHQQRPQRDEDSEDDEHGGHECAAESHPESFNYVIKDSSQILPTFVVVFEYDPEAERRSRQKVTCENCERRVATVFCQSDAANLCDQCDAEMHSSKLASRHTRVPLEGNGAQTFSHCRIHPDKIVEFFCPSCSRPVCVHCKMVGHHSTGDAARHKLITIAEAFKSVAESANSVDPILESRKAAIHAQKESVDERAKQVIANADAIQSQLDEIYQRAQADLKALLKKKLNVLRGDVVELDRELAEIRQLEAFLEYQKSGPNATQFILDWSHHQRLRTELHSFPFFRESIDVLPDIRVNGSIQVHVESALHAGGGFGMSMADFGGEKRFSGVGAAAAASGRPRATPTIDLSAYKIRKATEYVADLNLNAVAPNAATPQYSVTTASHDRQPSVNLAELRTASIACGLASTASRRIQLEALESFYFREARKFPLQTGPVLSLDLGLRNLAACVVEGRRVLSWEKYDLSLPETYCPRAYAERVGHFCSQTLLPHFTGRYIFIERQRHRSGSMASVLETIVRLAILEAQLHVVLGVTGGRFVCTPMNPAAVARFHGLPPGREKKQAAVEKVRSMHADESISIPAELFEYFSRQAKKDDLADSLLQAVAGVAFRRNCQEFFELKHPELLGNKQIELS